MPYKSMFLNHRQITARSLLIAAVLAALVVAPFAGCSGQEPHYYTAKVPITFKDLNNIGSLHIEVEFDDRLITPVKVEEAAGLGGIFSYGMESTSKVVIGLARVSLKGSGTIAYISYKVNGDVLITSDIVLSNVIATYAATNKRVDLTWESGSINPADRTIVSPGIMPLP